MICCECGRAKCECGEHPIKRKPRPAETDENRLKEAWSK